VNSATARAVASVFDPARLRIARHAAMITKKDLAQRIGVTPAAVSQYENGTTTPSAKVVASLALALGLPVEFFAADRPLGEAPTTVAHFRSLRATTQQERDRAFAHALLTWEFTKVLQRSVRLPALDLPTDISIRVEDPLSKAEDAARRAREYFGLATGPIPHVIRLMESRGVICTRLPAQTHRVFAFSCSFPERPVVVLAAERTHRAASRFDASHELGHLVMHPDEEPGSHPVERQANAFAAEFLAPAAEIADLLPSKPDWKRFLELKSIWGISIQALLYRAKSLRVMPEHVYRRAITEVSARGWRTQEPGDDGSAENPYLLAKAVSVAELTGVTLLEIALAARIPIDVAESISSVDERLRVDF
jgi:Zn-dependent peptidase ImmA (M78 family)/transcriptional regulator with XRE-family HTH domain